MTEAGGGAGFLGEEDAEPRGKIFPVRSRQCTVAVFRVSFYKDILRSSSYDTAVVPDRRSKRQSIALDESAPIRKTVTERAMTRARANSFPYSGMRGGLMSTLGACQKQHKQ